MEIKEGNKLIAEFLGYKYFGHNENKHYPAGWKLTDKPYLQKLDNVGEVGKRNYLCRNHNELRFYNEWNWLMPVVEKIEIVSGKNTEITFWQGKQRCIILDYDNVNDLEKIGETKIEATYLAVIEFINWYNNHLTPPL